jgi:hypothetical protein
MPAGCFRSGQAFLVAFLPSEFSPLLKAGQPAMVYLSELEASEPANGMNRRVAAVSPALSSPAAVRARYTLDASTGLLVKGPTVATLIRLDEAADTIVGSVGEVQIQVGTQRGLAFLPGFGRLFSVESHASE